jgi:hypothetical protein
LKTLKASFLIKKKCQEYDLYLRQKNFGNAKNVIMSNQNVSSFITYESIQSIKNSISAESSVESSIALESSKELRRKVKNNLKSESFKCYICECEFTQRILRDNHVNNEHNDKCCSNCHLCDMKNIMTPRAFNHHLRSHFENVFKFMCEHCGKGFEMPQHLRKHTKLRHEFSYCYFCDLCSSKFKDRQTIQQHMVTVHLRQQNYKCNECSKAYTAPSTLANHKIRVHDAPPKYKCLKCEVGYAFKHEFLRHQSQNCKPLRRTLTKENKEELYNITKDNKYQCRQCQKVLKNLNTLMVHVQMYHRGKIYECEICKKICTTNANLKKHKAIHLGNII